MGAMPRTQQQRSDGTRQAIVSAAREVFAERGYNAVSVEEIAQRAGVSKGALYHQYRDKVDVLAAAYEDLEREMSQRIIAAASLHADPVDALRAGCHAFLDECSSPTTRRLALVDAPAGLGWERWRAIDARHGFGLLRFGLQAAADAGRVRADHIESRAHLLLAALMEGALLIGTASDPDATRRDIGMLIDEHIDGLVTRSASRPRRSSPRTGTE